MTAHEIRMEATKGKTEMFFLREIAAQLAELNERNARLDSQKAAPAVVYWTKGEEVRRPSTVMMQADIRDAQKAAGHTYCNRHGVHLSPNGTCTMCDKEPF